MTKPQALQKGDLVTIVATARKISMEEIGPMIHLLQQWGLTVHVPDGLFSTDNQFAGSDAHRAAMLQNAINDPNIKAIFCARGGYGTVRIVDLIDFSPLKTHPKWIVGYSDVTVLHSHIHTHIGIPTLHATMPIDVPSATADANLESILSLREFLFDQKVRYTFASHPLNRKGVSHGTVVGGNLSILYSICGSPSDIDTDNKILFIEDLDEYLYHIDRMMRQLKRCGKLSNLKALMVGPMVNMHDNTIPFGQTAEEIIMDTVREYDYPVFFNAPFGHISTQNKALPLGIETNILPEEDFVHISLSY